VLEGYFVGSGEVVHCIFTHSSCCKPRRTSVSRRYSLSRGHQLWDLCESFVLFIAEAHRGRGDVLLEMFN
jgi:hypothetical protein